MRGSGGICNAERGMADLGRRQALCTADFVIGSRNCHRRGSVG